MTVRNAEEKDIDRLLELLTQVQAIHTQGRPDLFEGTHTKYRPDDLRAILRDEGRRSLWRRTRTTWSRATPSASSSSPTGAATSSPRKALYIDDLCVDQARRGEHIGQMLYAHVQEAARAMGCYHITLNVWSLNQTAARFYEKMGLKPLKVTMESPFVRPYALPIGKKQPAGPQINMVRRVVFSPALLTGPHVPNSSRTAQEAARKPMRSAHRAAGTA